MTNCKTCGVTPITADVGGYIPCIEICCPKCLRAAYGRTMEEATMMWDSINTAIKKE
jgi:hypothetical protein